MSYKQLIVESVLAESSMTRFLRKFAEYDAAIITAYRGEYTKSENQARNKKLFSMLNAKGYSITSVKGSYIENHNTPDAMEVSEHSFVVVNHHNDPSFLRNIIRLGTAFDQDSILEIKQGTPPEAVLHGTSRRDNAWPSFGQTHTLDKGITLNNTSSEFFTRLGNAKLAFLDESATIKAPNLKLDSVAGFHGLKVIGKQHWREI